MGGRKTRAILQNSQGFRGRAARGASPLGRGGAALREPKSRAGDVGRARPGCRAAGCWGGSYLGLRRGGHHSPFLFGGSRFPPSVSRVRPEKNSRGRRRWGSDSSARVGPAALGSQREASAHPPPCQRDSARPGQAQPPPYPAQRARVGTAASTAVSASARGTGISATVPPGPARTFRQPPPTASASPVGLGLRAPDPAHAAPPRATLRQQPNRRARTYLPRPLQPSPGQPRPAPPPHVTLLERAVCACANTPLFLHPRVAPPSLSFLTLRPC